MGTCKYDANSFTPLLTSSQIEESQSALHAPTMKSTCHAVRYSMRRGFSLQNVLSLTVISAVLLFIVYWLRVKEVPSNKLGQNEQPKHPMFIQQIHNQKQNIEDNQNVGELEPVELAPPIVKEMDKVRLDVYMEALCPDTTNFIETQLWPTYVRLHGLIDLHLYPFGKADCFDREGDIKCRCQHGQQECDMNIVMNCVLHTYANNTYKALDIIQCLQGNVVAQAPECWQEIKVPEEQSKLIEKCSTSVEGKRLHYECGLKTKALRPSMFYVPWVLIDSARNQDALSMLKELVCAVYQKKNKVTVSECSME